MVTMVMDLGKHAEQAESIVITLFGAVVEAIAGILAIKSFIRRYMVLAVLLIVD